MHRLTAGVLFIVVTACSSTNPKLAEPTGGGSTSQAGGAGQSGSSDTVSSNGGSGSAGAGIAGTSTTGGIAGGAGGTPASTAGSGGLGAGGGTTMMQSPPGFFADGYLMSGPWMGWIFTYTEEPSLGSSVAPQCTKDGCVPAWGTQPCLQGTVAKNASSGTFVGLGFHNVDPVGGPQGTWKVTGTGLYVSISTPPALARVQLQEPNTTSNDQRYCAPVPPGGTGVIPFSSFKTYCWGDPQHPSKVLADKTEIHETAIVVPGNAAADVPFSFCLVDIAPR